MKYIFLFLIVLFSKTQVFSQNEIDYIQLRAKVYGISCTAVDSELVEKSILNLFAIDSSSITVGKDVYYYDLGIAYYTKALLNGKLLLLDSSNYFFECCLRINPDDGTAYRCMVTNYLLLKQKEKAKDCLERYKAVTKESDWDMELLKLIDN